LNQFENEGPRTNNHAEGHNSALNKGFNTILFLLYLLLLKYISLITAIGSANPNFYNVIDALKIEENYIVWKWLSNKGIKLI